MISTWSNLEAFYLKYYDFNGDNLNFNFDDSYPANKKEIYVKCFPRYNVYRYNEYSLNIPFNAQYVFHNVSVTNSFPLFFKKLNDDLLIYHPKTGWQLIADNEIVDKLYSSIFFKKLQYGFIFGDFNYIDLLEKLMHYYNPISNLNHTTESLSRIILKDIFNEAKNNEYLVNINTGSEFLKYFEANNVVSGILKDYNICDEINHILVSFF